MDNYLFHCSVFSLLAFVDTSPIVPTSCSKLAPRGTLSLGAAHSLTNNEIQINRYSNFLGKISLFRLWGRERSKQEVTSLNCTEGDLVKWEVDHWYTQICAPLPVSNLRCGEEVILKLTCKFYTAVTLSMWDILLCSQQLHFIFIFLVVVMQAAFSFMSSAIRINTDHLFVGYTNTNVILNQ